MGITISWTHSNAELDSVSLLTPRWDPGKDLYDLIRRWIRVNVTRIHNPAGNHE